MALQQKIFQHSAIFEDMAQSKRYYGTIDTPDGCGIRTGECGDTVEMFLRIKKDVLQQIRFQIDGCRHTMAAANSVATLMEGRKLADAWEISPQNVADFLQTLPEDHFHCAELATGAFYNALSNYNMQQKEQTDKTA